MVAAIAPCAAPQSQQVLASVLRTADQRGLDATDVLVALLTAPTPIVPPHCVPPLRYTDPLNRDLPISKGEPGAVPERYPRPVWELGVGSLGVDGVSSYRFCRSDDIALLVDALNRCWAPHFPDEPPMTPAAFKRSIRDLQVWCSSCMVAFSGSDPIGVLIGAKRPSGTLIHRIAVHPDHRRQGHGRHLLDSLGSKLAILGPPRIVAEVPETLASAPNCSAQADMCRKRS